MELQIQIEVDRNYGLLDFGVNHLIGVADMLHISGSTNMYKIHNIKECFEIATFFSVVAISDSLETSNFFCHHSFPLQCNKNLQNIYIKVI